MRRPHQRSATATRHSFSKSILIEGWRVTNHSLALVNQHQIVELCRLGGLRLFHRDVPLHMEGWDKDTNNSGFSSTDRLTIDALTDPAAAKVDCTYRIFSPFRASPAAGKHKTVTFIVTEFGPFHRNFEKGSERPELFTRDDDQIVTPTRWSRDRLVDWGFPPDKVSIVPHGVDSTHFRPSNVLERQAVRRILGIGEDEIVFLNVGAALWNKGVDLLLLAFAHLRGGGRPIRLVLRNRIDMYGISISTEIQKLAAKNPGLFIASTMAAVSVISHDMSRDQLRLLYSAADCYVSPYRAEGFNLPVLEAIACGTPVIVTRGGATDDFCDDQVAVRIAGTPGEHEDAAEGHRGKYITPNINELVEAMDCFATRQNTGLDRSDNARNWLIEKFSWRNAALQLARVTAGYGGTG